MSLIDKMNMWAGGAKAQSPEPVVGLSEPEWPESAEDDTEDTSSHPNLPLYSQAIFGSEAYKLLLEDLRRESSLHSDTSRVWTMDTVRHQIMGGLPPIRISKNQNPCVHDVEFLLPVRGIKERLLREGMRRGVHHHGAYDPASAVVLVGSSNNYTQAATLEEYVDQTWDSRGSRLLDLIKSISALDFKPVDSYCKLDIRTTNQKSRIIQLTKTNPTGASGGLNSILHSVSTPDVLSIRAKGLSYSISEYGTELCWMASALQNSDAIVRYNPSVFAAGIGEPWEINAQVDTTPGPINNISGLSALQKLGWFDKYIEPVIAQGFPTARRTPEFSGVELSPAVLLSLVQQDSLHWSEHPRRFSGPRCAVQLVKQRGPMCLWHAVTTEEQCRCPKDFKLHIPVDIKQSRHILGDCLQPSFVPSEADTSFSDQAKLRVEQSLEAPHGNPDDAASRVSLDLLGSSESTTMCPDTSVDSDMMSIPDTPEVAVYDVPDELCPVLDAVARQLHQEYRDTTLGAEVDRTSALTKPSGNMRPDFGASQPRTRPQGEHTQPQGQVNGKSTSSAADTPSGSGSQASANRTKRTRTDDNDKDDQDKMPPPKKARRGHALPTRKVLACPFWKLEPAKYRQCLKLECFREVNRVKQHLTRKHAEPKIYCDMCKLTFEHEPAKICHLQQDRATCVYKPWTEQLITRSQQGELHKKSKADTERDKWFDIWDILFPGAPRPSSPFIDESMSDDFRHFREYAGRRGRTVLLERLRAAGFTHQQDEGALFSEDAVESYRLEAVERALDFIMDDFLVNRPSSESSTGGRESSGLGRPGRATPTSSFADSGIDSSSNLSRRLQPALDLGDSLLTSEFSFDFGDVEPSLDLLGSDQQIQFSDFSGHNLSGAALSEEVTGMLDGLTWGIDAGQDGANGTS
jgi:hypothetical protein